MANSASTAMPAQTRYVVGIVQAVLRLFSGESADLVDAAWASLASEMAARIAGLRESDVSSGTNFYSMFDRATSFNADISGWPTFNGTEFEYSQ